jgi:DNA invertase Pin-like site-specific DNA recombinase
MSKVGYARVSSTGQSLEIQLDKLSHCEKVFSEKKSATSTNGRTALKECLNYLREGDQLIITRLDRLARSVMDLTKIAHDLQQRKIDLVVIDQSIDTLTPTGKLMFNMLGAIAEFETELRKERQADGILKALDNGVKFGAKSKLTEQQTLALKQDKHAGMTVKELMKKYQLSKASVYRMLSD